MNDYFRDVVRCLTIDDLRVMGYLLDNDSTTSFKAIKSNDVQKAIQMSEGTYRRIVYRLVANRFVDIVTIQKRNAIYITNYGVSALSESIEGVGA
ncbi:hypothetical protein [Paenibacillus xylaniclasticus]|uniref:hypothetical protein n=1 Tax=Paenibacillus xylaniclasticus TaxID=588083 RepID=UPI000FD97CED|nr:MULTISPECIES: hypothetical protein [Paenibacillus]GFN32569.1 hypothetical protein PCURB6_28290 [Paenibacillus curdlanolyticus]